MQLKPTCLIGACPLSSSSGEGGQGLSKPRTQPHTHKDASTHVLHARDCIDFCTHKHARTACTRLACTNMYEHTHTHTHCMHVIAPYAFFFFSTLPDFFSQFFVCAEGKRPRFFFSMFFRMPGERDCVCRKRRCLPCFQCFPLPCLIFYIFLVV